MRCPDCNKFVPNEVGEPELDLDVELEEEEGKPGAAKVSGTVRLVLTCGDCSSELAEANLDLEETEVELKHRKADTHDVEVADESAEAEDRYDGKPKTPSRYRRHFYGARVSGTVKCSCGAEAEFETLVEEQASGFEQLY